MSGWSAVRPAGLLGGMAALPGDEWTRQRRGPPPCNRQVSHVFTHFSLDLSIVPRAEPVGEGWWQPIDRSAGGTSDALPARRRA